jgi:flagellin-like protein
MNVFGQRERSWRKARKRAVSPIIATILLVAITVVLAAVLYVLISGLTHGTGAAPLGTNFNWGSPENTSGQASLGCTGATSTYCYSIEIISSVTTSNFVLAVHSGTGATLAWPGSQTGTKVTAVTVSLISPTASTIQATYTPSTSAWALENGFSGSVGSGFTLVMQFTYTTGGAGPASGVGAGMFGDEIVAIGTSGYSGSVPSNAFS